MLVVSCTSGLCNRIHAILGSKILAHKLGRDFSVYWPRNGELDLSFQDLFESDIKLILQKDLLRRTAYPGCTLKVYNANTVGPREYENVGQDDTDETILIKPWTSPLMKGQTHDLDQNKALSKTLQSLPFRKRLVSKATPEKYQSYVGVHIRYGDYRKSGINHTECFSQSSVESFEISMEAIRVAFPEVRFYVSCPNPDIKRRLASRFNVEYRDIDPTRSPQGIKDAVVDLINLSGCVFCLGSYQSQFSQFLSLMSNKIIGMVCDNPHVAYGTCGMSSSLEDFPKWVEKYSNAGVAQQEVSFDTHVCH